MPRIDQINLAAESDSQYIAVAAPLTAASGLVSKTAIEDECARSTPKINMKSDTDGRSRPDVIKLKRLRSNDKPGGCH